ncbi:protein LYK5-like [Olea europaea var. sylvestris]|uniref:protein LYK5-like n=1 Tax=Olea europaea var. sylvestris TaxID=158386 RepID=UPI000C1D5878|nr:protein LYK5-like [Olea europaea var. sylvestris]
MADYWWSFVLLLLLLLVQFPELQGQQSYVNNRQLNCQQNDTTTLGYVCNGVATSCRSYLTFRSTLTYNSAITIANLLAADASEIAQINNITDVGVLPVDTLVVVPVNCSCSGSDSRYQHNTSYTIQIQGETYFIIANDTYQALTSCQAMEANNPDGFRDLVVNMRLNVPLWCACPTANQTAAGFNYLLTYLIRLGDSYRYIADAFSGAGADVPGILNANNLSENDRIFFFTPILVPLTEEPTKENINILPPPPPPPPPPPTTPSDQSGGSSRKWVFIGVGIGAAVLLLVLISVALFFRHRRARRHQSSSTPPSMIKKLNNESVEAQPASWSVSSEGIRNAIETLTVYKFGDLQTATGSFAEANRINGSVYRGSFKGDDAAVKVMKGDVSHEIDVLRQINHSHIIRLSGFCLHQGITYLVYEYAENGSLSDWLQNNKMQHEDSNNSTGILDWKHRVQIAYDIVNALNYLHNFTNPPYIHKNLKSSNVLLDSNMRVKVANFGLARSSDHDHSVPVMTRHVVGTYGYMAPEYIENGLITPKLDVFSFGVVLLELMSGKEAIAAKDSNKEGELLSAYINEVLEGENVAGKLRQFMDPRLGKGYPTELAYSMAELAKNCVAHDLNSRLTVADVFMVLSKILSSSLDWVPSDDLQNSISFGDGR